jgi:hypothetical protein
MTRHLVNDDLEGMWKEEATPKSGLLPSHLIEIVGDIRTCGTNHPRMTYGN